jgi:TolB-like protein/Flp pilus assembly protein TadD
MSKQARVLSGAGRFLYEARARRVPQACLAYVALGWLILQAGDVLFPMVGLPDVSMRMLLALLIVGFPAAAGLAWFFDLSPTGLRRDPAGADGASVNLPHLAALLVLHPTESAEPLPAGLRHRLRGSHATAIERDGFGLAAEFRSAHHACESALQLLLEHGTVLRAGIALGELSHVPGHFAGTALEDVHAIARHAPAGGLAVSSALYYGALVGSHPALATRMRLIEGDRRRNDPQAWIALPDEIATLGIGASAEDVEALAQVPSSGRGALALGLTVTLLLAVALALWVDSPPAPAADASIAVLPFTTLSSDLEDAYFAEGLADELHDALAALPGLRVAARHSAYALHNEPLEIRALGERLGVATVLRASVRRDGSQLRISTQLADTRTGYVLWNETYERELIHVFTVQREIAQAVVHALIGAMPGDGGRALAERLDVTTNVDAYDAYLRGRQLLQRRSSAAMLAVAVRWFEAALDIDPAFARAQAGICTVEVRQAERTRDGSALSRAQSVCDRAWVMAPDLPDVSLARGYLLRVNGELESAADHFTHALDDVSLRAEAFLGLAQVEAARRDDALALEFFRRALAIDGGNWRIHNALGVFHYDRRNLDEAASSYKNAIRLAPEDAVNPWNNLGVLHAVLGDYEDAAKAFARAVAIEPTHSAVSNLGSLRFFLRDYAAAAQQFQRAVAMAPTDFRMWANLGEAFDAQPGRAGEALDAYLRAAALGSAWLGAQREGTEDAGQTALLAWIQVNAGDADLARELCSRAEGSAPEDPFVALYAAKVFARLGDAEAARERVARALAGGLPEQQITASPLLAPLLPHPG